MEPMETVNLNETIEDTDQTNEPSADAGTDAGADDSVAGESSQPEFDPRAWGYKYKGQEIYPKDRNHLITLAQQGHMASQRMAELNKRAQELDELQRNYDPYKQLDEVFKSNPKFAQKIWDMYQRAQAGEDVLGSNDGSDPVLGKVTQEIHELKSGYQRLQEEREDVALAKEIEDLKSKYSEHDWDLDDGDGSLEKRILKHALDGGFNSLESAYRDMMWDTVRTDTEASTLRKAKEQRLQEKKAGVIDKGGAQRPAAKPSMNIRDVNWNQIAEAAIKGL